MPTATISSKGQVTIPKKIREHLRVGAGDRLDFVLSESGDVIIEPATRTLRDLRGMLPKPAQAATLEQMDLAIAAHVSRRAPRGR